MRVNAHCNNRTNVILGLDIYSLGDTMNECRSTRVLKFWVSTIKKVLWYRYSDRNKGFSKVWAFGVNPSSSLPFKLKSLSSRCLKFVRTSRRFRKSVLWHKIHLTRSSIWFNKKEAITINELLPCDRSSLFELLISRSNHLLAIHYSLYIVFELTRFDAPHTIWICSTPNRRRKH